MIEDFRGAVSAVAEAAENQPSQLRAAVSTVFRLADRVPADARVEGLAALTGTLRAHQWSAGVAADIALLCGALVESGVPAGPAGVEVMRQLAEYGKLAGVFLHVWQKTGDDAPPHPSEVGEASEERVTPELEQLAPLATTGWWVSHRYGLAAKTMLCDPGVRAALREDPRTLGSWSSSPGSWVRTSRSTARSPNCCAWPRPTAWWSSTGSPPASSGSGSTGSRTTSSCTPCWRTR
ncbi:hypothetical protein HFP72_15270 [Nocardiopsis sp. ARC36]